MSTLTRVDFSLLHKATWPWKIHHSRLKFLICFSCANLLKNIKFFYMSNKKAYTSRNSQDLSHDDLMSLFVRQFYSTPKTFRIQLYYKRRSSPLLNYACKCLTIIIRLILSSCKLDMWMDFHTECNSPLLLLSVITQDTPAYVNLNRFSLA